MKKGALICAAVLSVVLIGVTVWAGDPHPIARPFADGTEVGDPSSRVDRDHAEIPVDHLVLGAEHILDQQCFNGGFGWPHDDCTATYHNITAPILLGSLATYYFTREPTHIVGPLAGGAYDLGNRFDNGESRFGTFAPMFMAELALAGENPAFTDHVAGELFDELASGTYGPDDLDTSGWISSIETGRTGTWVNLRPWEFHTLIPAAKLLGQPGQEDLFEQAVLDGLATLDNSDPANVYSDIIGLAGAVRGLGEARRLYFPAVSAPLHSGVDGIDNLQDLAFYLASLQNPDGSWYWHSNLAAPTTGDEDVQTTAYALLALLEVDVVTAADYQPITQAARDWLVSLQQPDGGFPVAPGGTENTEVEGEAVTAISRFDATIFVGGFEASNLDLWSRVEP
jgi:hypothetical protein